MKYRSLIAAAGLAASMGLHAGDTPAPDGATVYFIEPMNGATVSSPIKVVMGLSGMGIAPAGTVKEHTAHHHLLINSNLPDLNAGIPSDANHVHFGGGQTETTIELPPGSHTLQLLLGDHLHIPHEPAVMSAPITITVE